jgi:hypothetical protein
MTPSWNSLSKFDTSVPEIICLLRWKSWYTHGKIACRQPLGSKKEGNIHVQGFGPAAADLSTVWVNG